MMSRDVDIVMSYYIITCSFQDIIYCYPSGARGDGGDRGGGEGSVTQLLVQLRGVFLTLSDVMASITAESRSW